MYDGVCTTVYVRLERSSHPAGVPSPDAFFRPVQHHHRLVSPRHAVAEVHAVPQHHRPGAPAHEVQGQRAPAGVQRRPLAPERRERTEVHVLERLRRRGVLGRYSAVTPRPSPRVELPREVLALLVRHLRGGRVRGEPRVRLGHRSAKLASVEAPVAVVVESREDVVQRAVRGALRQRRDLRVRLLQRLEDVHELALVHRAVLVHVRALEQLVRLVQELPAGSRLGLHVGAVAQRVRASPRRYSPHLEVLVDAHRPAPRLARGGDDGAHERGGAEARGPHAHPKRDLLRRLCLLTHHGRVRRGDVRDASVRQDPNPVSRELFLGVLADALVVRVEDVVRGLHDGD
mmetsp:Transcript_10198/g.42047  ORF Transcript_10198/g.42047 Transcript_10198/m.42047 type:complete len:345 (-) Transcript_10198:595-1629(-)